MLQPSSIIFKGLTYLSGARAMKNLQWFPLRIRRPCTRDTPLLTTLTSIEHRAILGTLPNWLLKLSNC